jgi:hypothetical protein
MKIAPIKLPEFVWGALDLFGCLAMVAAEMLAFWLMIPKR